MATFFPSDEWIKLLMVDINNSSAYQDAAKNWEGDFHFIIEPGGTLDKTVILYLDLWHGKCRQAYAVDGSDDGRKPAFRIKAPVNHWKKVITRQLDPLQAMMTGQLRLSGNMAAIMRHVRAAWELVECCTHIDTIFPV